MKKLQTLPMKFPEEKQGVYQPLYKIHMDVLHNQTFLSVHPRRICKQALPRKQQPVKIRKGKEHNTHSFKCIFLNKFTEVVIVSHQTIHLGGFGSSKSIESTASLM